MPAVKVLLIVDNYRYAKNLQNMLDWGALGLEVVGLEYNGALALEQFRILEPEIVIIDTLVPIIGVEKYVQLMQGFSSSFVVILLDDSGDLVSSNIQHVYKTLKKSNLEARMLTDTLKDSVRLLKKEGGKENLPRHNEKINALTDALGNGEFSMDVLIKLRQTLHLNLSARVRILLPRPSKQVPRVPDALVFELTDILDKFCGGEVIVMKDGLLCILINEIESNTEFSSESRYDQLLYEIRWAMSKYLKPHFTFFLSKSIALTELADKYKKLHQDYKMGYFLREVKIVNPNYALTPTLSRQEKICEPVIVDLANQILHQAAGPFEHILRDTYLNKLKQTLSFPLINLFRFKLELLAQAVKKTLLREHELPEKNLFTASYQTIEDEFESINDFFKDLFKRLGPDQTQTNTHVFNALVQVINYFQDAISLTPIARNILVTPTYLSHLFTKELGINFSDYLSDVRILRAKRLILHESYRINEVAQEAGFSDYRYFSQVFRKVTGVTPSEYRQRATADLAEQA